MPRYLLLLAYAELAEPCDRIFICGVKRLKPTGEFRHWTFVDNMRHCLLAAAGAQWVVSYVPYMQRSSTDNVNSISYLPGGMKGYHNVSLLYHITTTVL